MESTGKASKIDKYDSIHQMFAKSRDVQTDNERYTREKATTKIKAIRQNYRKAIDSGRKSGGGRVAATFYEICQDIWSGSPATESIASGVESTISANVDEDINGDVNGSEDDGAGQSGVESEIRGVNTEGGQSRTDKMATFLKERRNKVIEKKLPKIPIDQQLLNVAQEELAFKKEMVSAIKMKTLTTQ